MATRGKSASGRDFVSIDASQVEHLVEQLEEISGDNLKKNLKAANRAVSKEAASAIKSETPTLTGALQRTVKASPTTTMGRVAIGSSQVPYAGPIIFGWPERGIEPHPFPFDAIEASEQDIMEAYEDGVNQLLEQIGLQ